MKYREGCLHSGRQKSKNIKEIHKSYDAVFKEALIDNGTIRFTPIIINLGERDGDALLRNIKAQIENNEPVNELCLIYLPLYHSEHRNAAELLMQVVELAPLIAKSKEESEKIMVMSAVLSNKFVDAHNLKKIWEAIKMNFDDLWLV